MPLSSVAPTPPPQTRTNSLAALKSKTELYIPPFRWAKIPKKLRRTPLPDDDLSDDNASEAAQDEDDWGGFAHVEKEEVKSQEAKRVKGLEELLESEMAKPVNRARPLIRKAAENVNRIANDLAAARNALLATQTSKTQDDSIPEDRERLRKEMKEESRRIQAEIAQHRVADDRLREEEEATRRRLGQVWQREVPHIRHVNARGAEENIEDEVAGSAEQHNSESPRQEAEVDVPEAARKSDRKSTRLNSSHWE